MATITLIPPDDETRWREQQPARHVYQQCPHCLDVLPASAFRRDYGYKDKAAWCTACYRAWEQERRKTADQRRTYNRRYMRAWKERNRDKVQAARRARYAADAVYREKCKAAAKASYERRKGKAV